MKYEIRRGIKTTTSYKSVYKISQIMGRFLKIPTGSVLSEYINFFSLARTH